MNILKYIPYAQDAGFLVVHAAGLAVMQEDPTVKSTDRRTRAIVSLKEQLNKPGGFDLSPALNNDFSIGLALDVAVKLLNLIGLSRLFNSLKPGSEPK